MRPSKGVLALLLAACTGGVRTSQIDAIVAWSAQQHVKPGKVSSFRLPARFGVHAKWASVAHLADGRSCVLVITHIGYKDNFDGVLGCTGAIKPDEIGSMQANNRTYTYISLAGYGVFEQLFVDGKRDERTYDVYFDLN